MATDRSTTTYKLDTKIGQRLAEAEALKLEIDKMTARLDELKAELLAHATRYNLDNLALAGHPILAQHKIKPTWLYSEAVKYIEDNLRVARAKEQRTGIAVKQESHYIALNFQQSVILRNQESLVY